MKDYIKNALVLFIYLFNPCEEVFYLQVWDLWGRKIKNCPNNFCLICFNLLSNRKNKK